MIDLDRFPTEVKRYHEADIAAQIRRFISYCDWHNLARYVVYWGISFRVYRPMMPNGQRSRRYFTVTVVGCREWPYYERLSGTKRDRVAYLKSEVK